MATAARHSSVATMHRPGEEPPREGALHDRAMDNLRFIRDTMERAGSFTSVSGRGTVAVGAIGLAASALSFVVPLQADPASWLVVWLVAALVSLVISVESMRRKARRIGQSLLAGPARTFGLAFAPGIVAGAILTGALVSRADMPLLPATWLTIYGASVTAGGSFSVPPVPAMGATFMILGAFCYAAPAAYTPYFLGAGFGVAHILFGLRIARHHGG